jgi:Zn ribbon nucleic-acid-binding protein
MKIYELERETIGPVECPQCRQSEAVDVSPYAFSTENKHALRCRKCGHVWKVSPDEIQCQKKIVEEIVKIYDLGINLIDMQGRPVSIMYGTRSDVPCLSIGWLPNEVRLSRKDVRRILPFLEYFAEGGDFK